MQEAQKRFFHIHNIAPDGTRAFMDDEDCRAFLKALSIACERYGAHLLAFNLMPEQYDILVKQEQSTLPRLITSYMSSFTYHHRRKYGAQAKPFDSRARIRRVKGFVRVVDTVRYIWQIPLTKGTADKLSGNPWSSYRLLKKNNVLIDREELSYFMQEAEWQLFASSPCIHSHGPKRRRLTDHEALELLHELMGMDQGMDISALPPQLISDACKKAHEAKIPKAQIERILNLNRYRLKKALAAAE